MILWHESEDINKQTKKFISKILVDSNFTFTSHAWLCCVSFLHIDYFVESIVVDNNIHAKVLSFHTEIISV